MTAARILLTLALLAGSLAGRPAAQAIDVSDYFPLGVFNTWLHEQVDNPIETSTVRVKKVQLVDGVLQYTVAVGVLDGLESVQLVLGLDEGQLGLYALRVSTDSLDQIDVEKMKFDPPVVFGAADTELDVDEYLTPVDTGFEVEVSVGPFNKDVDVDVTGDITVRWTSVPDAYPTPLGGYGALGLARLEIDLDLQFAVDEGPLDLTEDIDESVSMLMANGTGILSLIGANDAECALGKAILPGDVLGEFPATGVGLQTLDFPLPGVLGLQGADAATTGGDFVITEVELVHFLDGRVVLDGLLAEVGAEPGSEVPVELKGKLSKGKLKLKGKAKPEGLAKPLALAVKTEVDATTTSISLLYKSGPDISGTLQLGVTMVESSTASLHLNGLRDIELEPKSKRKLGSEGVLTLGGASIPVTVIEVYKAGDGLTKPDKHTYTLTQTGIGKKLLRIKASSFSVFDYALSRVKGKLLGAPVKPELLDVTVGLESEPEADAAATKGRDR